MKISYDPSVDSAYIYLVDNIEPGVTTKPLNESINLDFNSTGQLVGVEVLSASKNLPAEIISST